MTRTRTFYRWLRAVMVVAALLIFLLLIVFPLLTPGINDLGLPPKLVGQILSVVQLVQIWMMRAVTMTWFFVLGSCLASFLNVVAWRVPRGQPITGSSHCPHCDTRLAFADNLPVIGWLRNEGLCRTCKSPIAVRYLIAEIVLGTIFLVLATVVFQTGGSNWPLWAIERHAGFEHLLFDPAWQLISILAWQLALMCFLFTVMLIESENRPVPVSIWLPTLLSGLVVAWLAPHVLLIPWDYLLERVTTFRPTNISLPLTAIIGTVVGSAVGVLVHFATSTRFGSGNAMVVGMAAIGLFLGWQAALFVGAGALAFRLMQQLSRHSSTISGKTPPMACVLLATFLFLLTWRLMYT